MSSSHHWRVTSSPRHDRCGLCGAVLRSGRCSCSNGGLRNLYAQLSHARRQNPAAVAGLLARIRELHAAKVRS
jgi:hypothetical protein